MLMARNLKYVSNKEFYEALKPEVIIQQQEFSKKRLPMQAVLRVLFKSGEIKVMRRVVLNDLIPCMPNFDTQTIERGYNIVSMHLAGMALHYNFLYSVNANELEKSYSNDFAVNDLKSFVKLPKSILQVNSGLYDLTKKQFMTQNCDAHGNEYFTPGNVNYDIVKLSQIDKSMLKVVKKIFNDWSQGDQVRLEFLKSLILAAAMGDGFKKYIIIQGPGGNGKSTFLNIIKGIVGMNRYLPFNVQDLENDAHMSMLHNELNVILGDDLENRAVLSTHLLNRFKQLVTGSDILVNRKFLSSIYVRMDGLKIQATNDFPRFMETGDMILDRVIAYQWSNVNYRKDTHEGDEIRKLTNHSLDELVGSNEVNLDSAISNNGNKDFYTALMSWVVHTTQLPTSKTFDEFQDAFRKETEEAFASSRDALEEVFVMLDEEGAFEYSRICVNAIYYRYVEYLKTANPSAKPTSRRILVKRLQDYLQKYPHIKKMNGLVRLTSIKYTTCNIREFTNGIEISTAKSLPTYKWLNEKSVMFENMKATHVLDEYTDQQIKLIMNEIAIREDIEIDSVYAMSKYEFENTFNTYKEELIDSI